MLTEKISVFNNPYANLYTYILDKEISTDVYKKRPAVIIVPGGSYLFTATKEGEAVATRFLSKGYHTFVLRYSTYFKDSIRDLNNPPPINKQSHYPLQLLELMESIRIIKENADKWYIDIDNIFVLGFSAGGHLTASIGTKWDTPSLLEKFQNITGNTDFFKPKGIVLGYPMLNVENLKMNMIENGGQTGEFQSRYVNQALFGNKEPSNEQEYDLTIKNHVRPDMPPVLLWQTTDDPLTKSVDATEFVLEMIKKEVTCEYHLFEHGKHGLSVSDKTYAKTEDDINVEVAEWLNLTFNWLNVQRSK